MISLPPFAYTGTILLRVFTGDRSGWVDAILNRVLYVPDLGVNILSVQAMVKAGLRCDFKVNGCTIRNRSRQVVGYAKAQDSLYILPAKPIRRHGFAVEPHRR